MLSRLSSEPEPNEAPTRDTAEMPFVLSSKAETLIARGVTRSIDAPTLAELPDAVREFSASRREPFLLVGVVPFQLGGEPRVYQPIEVHRRPGGLGPDSVPVSQDPNRAAAAASFSGERQVSAEPTPEVYQEMVCRALHRMGESQRLRKVVLARTLLLTSRTAIDPLDVLSRLAADPHVTTFGVPLLAQDGASRMLVGATPELLCEKKGDSVVSIPLGGSAKRSLDPAEDLLVAESLLRSEKNRYEHAFVVDSVKERLAPFCHRLEYAEEPSLVSTANMWHLATRVEGRVRDDSLSAADLVAALHPTAAVCGLPHDLAAAAISELEPFDRGYFAGAVGWCDSRGDGRWLVSIRCAELTANSARLFAGAGIVPSSDPGAETAETAAKFETLLKALGVDDADEILDVPLV